MKFDILAEPYIPAGTLQRSQQFHIAYMFGAQAAHPVPALDDDPVGRVKRAFERCSRLVVRSHFLCRYMEAQQQSLKSLEQGVVQFARDADSFLGALMRACADLAGNRMHADGVGAP